MVALRRPTAALVAAGTALALLASCTGSDDPSTANNELKNRTLSFTSCEKAECSGELDGARYLVRMPAKWNGTLLLYSHGYREAAPTPPDFAPVETDAVVASTPATADKLLEAGYALAGSSYATNGWAVADGVKAGEDLHEWFSKNIGEPDRVYVWGDSLGGLITQTIAEKHPEWVAGAAPMCGVLGGLNLNLDLGLDLQYAIKTLLYPEMKLTNFASHDEAVKTWQEAYRRIMAATKDTKNGVPKLLAIAAIADGPTKTARFDGATPVSRISASVEAALTGLGYATFGRYEIEQRVGGNPSSNSDADYRSRVTPAERQIADLLAPGAMDKALTALAAGEKIDADPDARDAADELGNPTGDLQDPTITMHTAYDQLVLVQNETVFAERVQKSEKRKADLVQLYTTPPDKYAAPAPYGAGHCNFTDDERVGLIKSLDGWVRTGLAPGPETVAKAMGTTNGYTPAFKPGPWPGSATE
jgi:pimeloyl-ACP methyl ester carboxylesterase